MQVPQSQTCTKQIKKIPNQQASIRGVEQQREEPTDNARGAKQHICKIGKKCM